jgi:glucose/arabinose dehydrogenase
MRALLVLSWVLVGCGRSGPPGAVPIEQRAPPDAPEPTSLPDPCRGLALPVDQHYVSGGLCARAVATGQGELRQIAFAPNGDLYGVVTDGAIKRFRDANGDGVYDASEISVWAKTGGHNGHNCQIDGGFLYAGSPEGVKRWAWDPASTSGGAGEDVVVGEPSSGHPFHPMHVWGGFLYVDSGAESNVPNPLPADYDTTRAVIKRFDLSRFRPGAPFAWGDGEIVVRGVRNVVGFARDGRGAMFGVVNGIDDLRYRALDIHADNPGEDVVRIEPGAAHGYPFCFTVQRLVEGGRVVPPGTRLHAETPATVVTNASSHVKDDAWCASTTPPVTVLQAHSAPLDIVFFEGPDGVLPSRWKHGAFITMHGSWDRDPPSGYKVVWLPFDASGRAPMPASTADATTFPYEVVFGGGRAGEPVDGPWAWHLGDAGEGVVRPVGVAISPLDGALYVSSDNGGIPKQGSGSPPNGAIYRIGLMRGPL